MRVVVLLCLLCVSANGQYDWDGPGRVAPDSGSNDGNACNVDQASCGCCLMLQEMNRLKTYFDTTLTDLEEDFRKTNQSLSTLKAKRASFTAALYTGDNFRCFGPFATNSVIVYKNVFLNLGAAYSTETGLFTVPFSGVYSLAVTSYSDSGSPGFTLAICSSLQVNGKTVAAAKDFNTNDKEDSTTIVVALQLTAGDKVSVSLAKGCFLCDDNSHYNTFSAFLLHTTE
ncbi:cerebellin 20 [Oryzias melastigma]|uniref:Cerebellin 20 n=1 Tax=Oryzias melastigma TaxID=30732 RepID=A0A3B3BIY3_ORYME|nr:cerebellin 20 [Oryzias melastigma]